MLAADTSSLIAFLEGAPLSERDVALIDQSLANDALCLPPVVLAELLSGISDKDVRAGIGSCPVLDLHQGYWERAGMTRRTVLKLRLTVKLADALIAQSCIDHDVALITRDPDFRHFAKHCGLKLA